MESSQVTRLHAHPKEQTLDKSQSRRPREPTCGLLAIRCSSASRFRCCPPPSVSTIASSDWGKLVHALDGACATALFGLLFLGWRDLTRTDVTDELAALLAMCVGILFGVLWEIVEFVRDWVAYSDLQKSNTDTMTDLFCNDVACIRCRGAGGASVRACHRRTDRKQLGETAEWLVDGPSRLLNRHGLTLTVIAVPARASSPPSPPSLVRRPTGARRVRFPK